MAQLKILDTGYVSATNVSSQTQLGETNRAGYTGSGITKATSFTLNTVGNLSISGGVTTESKPVLDSTTDSNTTLISTKNRIIPVKFLISKTPVTSGYSVNNIYQFSRMERTKGLKLLYPSATGDSIPTIVEVMGAVNIGGEFADGSPSDLEGTVGTSIPYLIGRVKNIKIDDNAGDKNFFLISFDFEVSG